MGLKFIFGRSGVGKTKYLREYILDNAIKNPKTNFVIMVPEQSNLQTQTDYVLASPNQGLINIDVLSFKRLAYHIFNEVGGFNNRVLDESGKLMVLKKVIANEKDKLIMLDKPLEKIDSVAKLKSILSEFSQYHINGNSLKEVIDNELTPGLSLKLKDLTTLQDSFLAYISNEYITDEQVMDVLAQKIELSDFVKNTVFVFDEYTGFTYLQNEVLRKLIKYGMEVIVSLTMDPSYLNKNVVAIHDLFALSVRTKTELTNIALEEKVKIHEPVCLASSDDGFEEFRFLESNLFNYTFPVYKKKTDRIIVGQCPSVEKEILFLRGMIAKLVREEGYSYRDIAVVTGDISKYGIYFEKLLNEANIPCFVDDSKALLNNSILNAIRDLISICIEDFSYNSVFRFFRNNLSNYTLDEIDKLENYCIARGIRSFNSWNREWDRCIPNQTSAELVEINKLRERFICEIKDFVFVLKDKNSTIKDMVYSLYSFLAEMNVENRLFAMSEKFKDEGDYVRFVEYKQVYAAIIGLMDELVEIMGDEKVSVAEFADIMDAGFLAVKIGVLPPGNDYVLLGDVERTRFAKTKVLFLLGANEGIIPKSNEKIGFLNESERLILKEAKVALSPTSHEEYYTQRYYLYRMLTKASEKLFICYSMFGDNGEECLPSYIVKNIETVFPYCERVKYSDDTDRHIHPETKADAYSYLLNHKADNPDWEILYKYLSIEEEYKNRLLKLQQGILYKGDEESIGEKLANKLYLNDQKDVKTSVSRLEAFAKCPFSHYLNYGLRLNERIMPEMAYIDYGSIFHVALENYVNIINKMGLDVSQVSADVSNELAKECIVKAYDTNYRAFNEPSARDKYHVKRMIRLMRRTVWAIKKQFDSNEFVIKGVEVKFDSKDMGYSVPLNNNRKMYLNGKIDRIDTLNDGQHQYIRIIDYKTGSTDFSMLKFYHGIQLQLVVYLDMVTKMAIEKEHRDIHPVGAFIYHINDPVIDTSKIKNDDVEGAIFDSLKLQGYQDLALERFADKAISSENINLMMDYSRSVVSKLGNQLISGDIRKSPYLLYDGGFGFACDRCNFNSVCHFDTSLPWCKERRLETYKDAEIMEKMKESEDADDELDQ